MRTIGFDIETTSPKRGRYLAVHECEIVGWSVAWAEGQAMYVTGKPSLFSRILESDEWQKVCHNVKFEWTVLSRDIGVTLSNFEDTKLAAYLLGYHSTHLKNLTRQILGRDPISYEQVTQGRDMSEIPPEEVYEYAAADSDNTLMLWRVLEKGMSKQGLRRVYEGIEKPIIPVLSRMEKAGIGVDEAHTIRLIHQFEGGLKDMTEVVQWLMPSSHSFNPGSSEQLGWALERMGCPVLSRTEVKGHMKTGEAELEAVRAWHPQLISSILEMRRWGKMRGYVQGFIELRGPDLRLHPSFHQAGHWEEMADVSKESPVTGRLSSSGPNLQNIPHHISESLGTEIRSCLLPREGWVLVSGDVGQEEARIAAFVCPEPVWSKAFERGESIYGGFGRAIYGREIRKQDVFECDVAKKSILSFIWGIG